MYVEIITAKETLIKLRNNWEDVYRADPESNFYMSWTWISGWFDKLSIQWIILAAKTDAESSDYIGFFPLQLRSEVSREGLFHNELRTGGGYFSGYTGFICKPEFEHDVVRAFSERIKQLNWRRLHLENIYGSPRRISAFLNEFSTNEFSVEKVIRPDDGDNIDHDIYVYVELPSDWDKFLYGIGTKPRRNARHALRPLEGSGEYKITLPTSETIEQDIEALLKFWEIQWAEKLASRYNQRLPYAMMSNFRHMLMYCFADDALFLPILWKEETRIGIQASLIDRTNRTLISLLNGRDLSIRRPPPGIVLHLQCIIWAIENGFKEYDLQTGNFSYKYDFGGKERRVECLRIIRRNERSAPELIEPISIPIIFSHAMNLYKEEKFESAAQVFRQILQVAPNHEKTLPLLTRIEAELQRTVPEKLNRAKEFHRRGQLTEAGELYLALTKADPKNFEATYLFGIVLLQQKKINSAERYLSLAITLRPTSAEAHYNHGLALSYLGRNEEALDGFNSAIALKPDYERAITMKENIMKKIRQQKPDQPVS